MNLIFLNVIYNPTDFITILFHLIKEILEKCYYKILNPVK